MYWDHIHANSPSNASQIHSYIPSPASTSCPLFSFNNPSTQVCVVYMLLHVGPSTAHRTSVRIWSSWTLSIPCLNIDLLDLVQVGQETCAAVGSLFHYSPPRPLALTIFLSPLLQWFPNFGWGEGCDIHVPLGVEHNTATYSLYFYQLWVSE